MLLSAQQLRSVKKAGVRMNRGTFLLPSVFFLVVLILSILSLTVANDAAAPIQEEIALAKLSTFISLATSYIVRISHTAEQDPSNEGKFTYIAYLGEDLPLDFTQHKQKSYNLLRHNGAIYSLALAYARQNDPSVLDAMQRSVAYLKREAIAPVPDVSQEDAQDDANLGKLPNLPNMLAAWETRALVTGEGGSVKAKLGGAGLALIALVSLEQIAPGGSDISYLRQIGEFIKYLQHDNGSFTCRYIPTEGGKDDSWHSLYYPGEAALGLVYLATIETDEMYKQRWITVATKAITYLENLRRTQDLEDIEPDHWALLATARLLPLLDKTSKEYWLVYDHGVRVVKSMLSAYSKQELKEDNKGCLTGDTRTCPTATRLEGMTAALSFVREEEMFVSDMEDKAEKLLDRMRHDLRLGISFLLESQETDETYNMQGGVPVKFPAEDQRAKEVRVDYVQHSMSAMIAYEKLLLSETGRGRLGSMMAATAMSGGDYPSWYLLVVVLVALTGVAVFSSRKKKKVDKGNRAL